MAATGHHHGQQKHQVVMRGKKAEPCREAIGELTQGTVAKAVMLVATQMPGTPSYGIHLQRAKEKAAAQDTKARTKWWDTTTTGVVSAVGLRIIIYQDASRKTTGMDLQCFETMTKVVGKAVGDHKTPG